MQDTDTIEANREYYRKSAARYDVDEQPFVHQAIFLEKLLSRFDTSSSGLHILDFGAGTGAATQTLVKSFPAANIVGLDVSPEMLAIASKKCPTASFNVFDGKQIPFASNSFDGILISSVLHHVQDYGRILLEISRVCKPKGWVLITQEPNPPVARCANRMRRLLARDLPDLMKRAEGYQFSKEGGIPPKGIINTLAPQGFSCELIYNNEALLDRFLTSNRLLYHLIKPICRLRLLPWHLSYNILAERSPSTRSSG